MAIGWLIDVSDADDYFTDERLDTDCWDGLGDSGSLKDKALLNAYNRIHYDPNFTTPDAGAETAAQKIKLRKAQCEMACYLAGHLADEDRRKGLQAQGVVQAGIVKETYDPDWLDKLPIPPFVAALLADFETEQPVIRVSEVKRNEDEDIDDRPDTEYP